MAPLILRILREKPMHGYEIIRTLETRSHGMWRPSPGSIYPTLQLLEEQGNVRCQEVDGKKVYSLTDEGTAQAEEVGSRNPWEHRSQAAALFKDLSSSLRASAESVRHIAVSGTKEQAEEAKRIILEAAERLSRLAAEPSSPHEQEK